MIAVQGFYKDGTPYLKIKVSGLDPNTAREFNAVIDTGFDGFMVMPDKQALALGLVGNVSADIILANASTDPRMMAEGEATIQSDSRRGMIILGDDSAEVLVGMGLLRSFSVILFLSSTMVLVASEAAVAERAKERGIVEPDPVPPPDDDAGI